MFCKKQYKTIILQEKEYKVILTHSFEGRPNSIYTVCIDCKDNTVKELVFLKEENKYLSIGRIHMEDIATWEHAYLEYGNNIIRAAVKHGAIL